jgi:hypothetical protein
MSKERGRRDAQAPLRQVGDCETCRDAVTGSVGCAASSLVPRREGPGGRLVEGGDEQGKEGEEHEQGEGGGTSRGKKREGMSKEREGTRKGREGTSRAKEEGTKRHGEGGNKQGKKGEGRNLRDAFAVHAKTRNVPIAGRNGRLKPVRYHRDGQHLGKVCQLSRLA